jgi:cytidylate kinase
MWKNINFQNCLSYIAGHVVAKGHVKSHAAFNVIIHSHDHAPPEDKIRPSARPSITISRMCGSGGRTVASELMEYLQSHTSADRRWTIFDKNLIEKVLEDHHLSKRLVEFLPEDRQSLFAEMVEKMRGLHPPTSTLVKQTVETVWNLAAGGYVILVGRAANVITERLDNVYHVRLVGSLENRIARVEEVYEMGRSDAREFIKAQDLAKRHYMKEYFGREIDDPMLYHMIINTDKMSYEKAARLIGDAVISRFKLAANAGITVN